MIAIRLRLKFQKAVIFCHQTDTPDRQGILFLPPADCPACSVSSTSACDMILLGQPSVIVLLGRSRRR